MAQIPTTEYPEELTLAQRREFMKLPLAERRRQLEAQAARMMEEYSSASESSLRSQWQGGDIVQL